MPTKLDRLHDGETRVVSTGMEPMRALVEKGCLVLCFSLVSGAIGAEQIESCAGLEGPGLLQCHTNQQTLRQQQQLELQLQQQQERQNQLDKQQREVQQQLEDIRLQNDILRKQLASESANPPARPVTTDYSKSPEVKSWRADNPWFGSDYGKTQFSVRYIKQLQRERPDLTGRPLLDAVSAKVDETFGTHH